MRAFIQFLHERIAEDEKAIRERDMNQPIHFVGCWYYNHSIDIFSKCDCDEDGEASRKALTDLESKHFIIDTYRHELQLLILLARPYIKHPDYAQAFSQGLQGL